MQPISSTNPFLDHGNNPFMRVEPQSSNYGHQSHGAVGSINNREAGEVYPSSKHFWTEDSSLRRSSIGRFMYRKATEYRRKPVQLSINGKMCFARPDSGADRNIMTAAFAKEHGVEIQRSKDDEDIFVMGNGQYTKSIGKALVPCRLLGGESDHYCWFHVMAKCSVPIILGLDFLRTIQLYTTNQNLLVDGPFSFRDVPSFTWTGPPKGIIRFSADGHLLTACADTGSDLNLMSLNCALEKSSRSTKVSGLV